MRKTLLALALVASLVAAAPSLAGDPPIIAKALALGTMPTTTIHAKAGSMILESFTIAPGGSFGWHRHGAPVAVVVARGTLTVFDPTVANCSAFKVKKGQAFVEPADHVHLARNDTRSAVTVYAMYLGVPKPSVANVGATAPAGCNA